MRIGIDLGGTKIAVAAMARDGRLLFEDRIATPKGDYDGSLQAVRELVERAERTTGLSGSVGIGMPGSLARGSGRVQNANSTWLNGRPLQQDLQEALRRPVRLANDANCFALSEAVDGAASQARTVFGVIVGTGCGGGIVIDKQLHDGPRGIAGEWGHTPLPWPGADESPGPGCWCGLHGCLETWISGTGMARDHHRRTGRQLSGEDILENAGNGDGEAATTLQRHADRMARGLAVITNLLDPDLIVLGGGLSNMPHLYKQLPDLIAPYVFAENRRVEIVPPKHGDASGVRGAAWLWPPSAAM